MLFRALPTKPLACTVAQASDLAETRTKRDKGVSAVNTATRRAAHPTDAPPTEPSTRNEGFGTSSVSNSRYGGPSGCPGSAADVPGYPLGQNQLVIYAIFAFSVRSRDVSEQTDRLKNNCSNHGLSFYHSSYPLFYFYYFALMSSTSHQL